MTTPPGVQRTKRFMPQFHYELLYCGIRGHELLGVDAEQLRSEDQLFAYEEDGIRWTRCLRCDSWLAMHAPEQPARAFPPDRSEVKLPLRGRPLRDLLILRAIGITKAVKGIAVIITAIALYFFISYRAELREPVLNFLQKVQELFGGVHYDDANSGISGTVTKFFTRDGNSLHLTATFLMGYGIVLVVESIGLWFAKRWAEYLAFLAGVSFIPIEIYELSHKVKPLLVCALVINVLIVLYMLIAKRLFGIRGGAAAEHAAFERAVSWEALERSAPKPTVLR